MSLSTSHSAGRAEYRGQGASTDLFCAKGRSCLAFSLVELLVVLGLIAVLIALLMPVLGAARSQARAVACASNVRQIYHSLLLYANDHHGHLPVFGLPDDRRPFIGI